MDEKMMEMQKQIEELTKKLEAKNADAEEPKKEEPKKEEQKEGGFGAWLKRHWKGVTAGGAGLAAAAASTVVAYKKGKQLGVDHTVQYYNSDGSVSPLDPNVE